MESQVQIKTYKLNESGMFELYEEPNLYNILNLKNLILKSNRPFEIKIELSNTTKAKNNPRMMIEVDN